MVTPWRFALHSTKARGAASSLTPSAAVTVLWGGGLGTHTEDLGLPLSPFRLCSSLMFPQGGPQPGLVCPLLSGGGRLTEHGASSSGFSQPRVGGCQGSCHLQASALPVPGLAYRWHTHARTCTHTHTFAHALALTHTHNTGSKVSVSSHLPLAARGGGGARLWNPGAFGFRCGSSEGRADPAD